MVENRQACTAQWIVKFNFSPQDDWRQVSGIAAIFCIFTLGLIYFIPESPSWLISKGRMDEARKALGYIRAIKHDGTTETLLWQINLRTYAI